jgi:hypothetical protein
LTRLPVHLRTREALTGAAAFLVANHCYKFHSFALETLAFLATWYALSALLSLFPRPR